MRDVHSAKHVGEHFLERRHEVGLDVGRQVKEALLHSGPRLLAQVVDELGIGLARGAFARVMLEHVGAYFVFDRLR